jgi:hypothetical protein
MSNVKAKMSFRRSVQAKSKEKKVSKTKEEKRTKRKQKKINKNINLPKCSPGEVLRRNVLQAKHPGEV